MNRPFDPVRDIQEFHEKFGLEYKGKPRALPKDMFEFREKFLLEELHEYQMNSPLATDEASVGVQYRQGHAIAAYLEESLDALVDLVYVALGTSYLHGFDFREAWRRVHEANMQKMRAAKPADSTRSDGKGWEFDIVKPKGWKAPNHLDLVSDHIHSKAD